MIGDVIRTRAALTALTLIPTLLVVGCTDDEPEPKFGPTPSETPSSPSSSATATAPARTPEETVRAWVDAQNTALDTGDTAGMEALSAPGCRGCADFTTPIERVYGNGGNFETTGWRIEGLSLRPSTDPKIVDLAATIAGGTTIASDGAEPIVYERQKELLVVKLIGAGDGWSISFIGFIT